jgi:glutamine synthetase
MLAAGLQGIEEGMSPPPRADSDETVELDTNGAAATLPSSLNDAISAAESGHILRKALGDHVFEAFLRNKRHEWEDYRGQIHQYEIDRYLSVL